ncbi:Acetyl esterase/lipase [Proteiniborus ethanoligenes]|uniref:Acetyl esterase/lipase n=1 Tax=Proteiniborus ethanoligenes TaxID=415015 RepID=A0A1H3N1W8_9FIRM|nr:alpha/beta hydrolase [Proteiniborus ethanoligenes]SDY82445.1 Acetyl esterase/lipase [Proteiniborus ethanoligenes]
MLKSTETYIYKKTDDCSICLDYYSSNIRNSPLIIYIHGGALIFGSRKDIISEQIRLYNKAGYSVASIDYRLAPETKLKDIFEDIKDALSWAKEKGEKVLGIDPKRIAIVGHSAGAYLGLLLGTYEDKPNAIISFYGYGDILADWYGKPSQYYCNMPLVTKEEAYNVIGDKAATEGGRDRFLYYLYLRQKGIWTREVSGYHTLFQKENIMPFCPIHNVNSDFPPTLLIHGAKDTDVPYEESLKMAKRLEEHGVDTEFIKLEKEGHLFDNDMKNPTTLKVFEQVLDFLKKHL